MVFFKVLTVAALALSGVQADSAADTAATMTAPAPDPAPEAPAGCGMGGQPVCTPPFTDREYECDQGYVGKEGTCVAYEAPNDDPIPAPAPAPAPGGCGKGGEPVCTPPFTDRQYECDFGFVGQEGTCVPYEAPSVDPTPAPAPADAPENCGEGGEPVCKPPFVDREFECNQGFVGEGEGTDRVCVPFTGSEECGRDQQPVCTGTRFECKFGFVGAEAEGGRICVPYEEEADPECPTDCGSDGQPACDSNPECCFGFMGANVRGQGRMCVPYVAKVVEEEEAMEATRKLLAASIF